VTALARKASEPDDARIAALSEAARPRVESASRAPQFSAGMVEVNVFRVAGHTELADRIAEAVGAAGPAAVAGAKRHLVETFGARNPERGWLGFVMFVAVLSSAFAAATASGIHSDPLALAPWAMVLAGVAVLAQVIVLAGARLRPVNRFIVRMQLFVVAALVLAAVLSFTHGLTGSGTAVAVCAGLAAALAVVVVVIRSRGGEATQDVDLSVERAYLRAIGEVDAVARDAQRDVDASLDTREAEIVVAVRTRLLEEFAGRRTELAGLDADLPAGAMIIASKADPDRWLPPAMAKSRKR